MSSLGISALPAPAKELDSAPASGQVSSALWRLELERAQWAQLSRNTPLTPVRVQGEGGAAENVRDVGDEVYAPERSTLGTEAQGQAKPGPRASNTLGADQESAPNSISLGLGGEHSPAGGASSIEPREIATADLATESSSAAPERLPLVQNWSRTNVYAYNSGLDAQVWVRDASLDQTESAQLAAALRSKLRAAGVKLSILMINGEAVLAPPSVAEQSDEGPLA